MIIKGVLKDVSKDSQKIIKGVSIDFKEVSKVYQRVSNKYQSINEVLSNDY